MNTNSEPLVSIIVATYNGQDYVTETLDSILTQEGVNFELIIVDDHSQDDTLKIVDEYVPRFVEKGVPVQKMIHTQNKGSEPAYLDGVTASEAPFFRIIDQDDTLTYKHALLRSLEFMQEHPGVGVTFTATNYVDSAGELIGGKSFPYPFLPIKSHNGIIDRTYGLFVLVSSPIHPLAQGSSLVRRACWDAVRQDILENRGVGYFDVAFAFAAMHHKEWDVAHLSEPSLNYRVHENNTSLSPSVRRSWRRINMQILDVIFEDHPVIRTAAKVYESGVQYMKLLDQLVLGKKAISLPARFLFRKLR